MSSEDHSEITTESLKSCTELIIVCCHAVYTGDGKDTAEKQWFLQDYQQSNPVVGKPGEHEGFIAHIVAGTLATDLNPRALLLFSGGKTKAFDRTEAEGYEKIFLHRKPSPLHHEDCGSRYAIEEKATDSYQNLLFSILRFRRLAGRYPESVTVITHAFKEWRFLKMHAPAIKWPARRIRVQGINPPFTAAELEQTQKGELENAHRLFQDDPYGTGEMLAEKRRARNWRDDALTEIAADLEPAVRELLVWKGGEAGREIFPGRLPWEEV